VGRILGVARVTDADSVRVPASPIASDHARPGAQSDPSAKEATSKEQAAGKGLSKQSTAPEAEGRTTFDKLISAIRLNAGVHRSSARLHLHPPELGRVLVDVNMVGDDLQLEVRTETSEARDLLWERAARLRVALEQHGVHVGRFEVTGDLTGDGASSTQLTSDGLPSSGGETDGHGRADASRSGRRKATHELVASDTGEDMVGNVVVGERRLDVRI
jgi:flagellar hook-length control protein FliK